MERLIIASRDHLRQMRVYELGIGNDQQAGRCGALSEGFAELCVRFFGRDSPPGASAGISPRHSLPPRMIDEVRPGRRVAKNAAGAVTRNDGTQFETQ